MKDILPNIVGASLALPNNRSVISKYRGWALPDRFKHKKQLPESPPKEGIARELTKFCRDLSPDCKQSLRKAARTRRSRSSKAQSDVKTPKEVSHSSKSDNRDVRPRKPDIDEVVETITDRMPKPLPIKNGFMDTYHGHNYGSKYAHISDNYGVNTYDTDQSYTDNMTTNGDDLHLRYGNNHFRSPSLHNTDLHKYNSHISLLNNIGSTMNEIPKQYRNSSINNNNKSNPPRYPSVLSFSNKQHETNVSKRHDNSILSHNTDNEKPVGIRIPRYSDLNLTSMNILDNIFNMPQLERNKIYNNDNITSESHDNYKPLLDANKLPKINAQRSLMMQTDLERHIEHRRRWMERQNSMIYPVVTAPRMSVDRGPIERPYVKYKSLEENKRVEDRGFKGRRESAVDQLVRQETKMLDMKDRLKTMLKK